MCESPLSGKGTTCTAGLRSQQEIRFRMVQGHDWLESQTPISQEFTVVDMSLQQNASGCNGCNVSFMLWHLVSFSDRSKCVARCKEMVTVPYVGCDSRVVVRWVCGSAVYMCICFNEINRTYYHSVARSQARMA